MVRPFLLTIAFLSLTLPAMAQDRVAAADKTETSAGAATRMTTASSNATVQVAPVFSIEGSTANQIASGQVAFQFSDFTLTAGAQTPLGTAKSATLADLDGLKSKTTGKLAILWMYWDIDLEAYGALLQKVCTEGGVAADKCTYLQLKNDKTPAGKERFRDLRRKISPGTVYFGGANAQIAPQDFKYLDPADLSSEQVRHTSWSVSALGGVLFSNSIMVAVNYKRLVAYSANDETQVCSPIGSLNSLQCSQQVLGAPGDPQRSNQTGFEVRKIFSQYFAVSPKLTRDWTKKTTGVELPLYFFRDSGGGLNGGISLGWRSDTKAFTATAFIGQVLGVITKSS